MRQLPRAFQCNRNVTARPTTDPRRYILQHDDDAYELQEFEWDLVEVMKENLMGGCARARTRVTVPLLLTRPHHPTTLLSKPRVDPAFTPSARQVLPALLQRAILHRAGRRRAHAFLPHFETDA